MVDTLFRSLLADMVPAQPCGLAGCGLSSLCRHCGVRLSQWAWAAA